ncbi:regulator of ime2 [Terramyces sp. JEL0728]|nr:regulator of ime2 [Terramyces sp. JEL0728]
MSSKKRNVVNPAASLETKEQNPTIINGIKLSNEPDAGKIITVTANDGRTGETVELSYSNTKVVGNGSFGVVFQAKLASTGEPTAVKKVLQDKRFKVIALLMADIWSSGCVMAELMLGQPLFPGESGVDQLVEIIKVLGTPTREQIKSMNPNYTEYKFPQIKAAPWSKVFRSRNTTPESLDLLSKVLDYTPANRPTAIEAMTHTFFDEIRHKDTRLVNGKELPELFNFSEHGRYN